ncbi:hypothetical protein E8E12_009271 [Didymella heteroderae]|uniref:Uncharacterized protein n=1 Tax=Didymella heteroderae TaxID=1769908 RepID=A0A9P4WTH7_9PLEO|nr:hypothetical protein E8E12_009271 [Didymella heteroderae]
MSSPKTLTYSILALILSISSYAQDSPQCSAIAPRLAYNASKSVAIPQLALSFLGDVDDRDVRIYNVTDSGWTVSAYIQPAGPPHTPNPNDTEAYLWLDVGDSDLERLGRTMRACHTFVPLQFRSTGNVTWSYDTLEKSVHDTGDCRSLVSEECLARLKVQYFNAGTSERTEYTECADINRTVPWECASSGMVAPDSRPVPQFNSSLSSHFQFPLDNSTREILNETDQLVCNGRNFSSSFGILASTWGSSQDYDVATNFPIMDIMTFFPTVPFGRTLRMDANRVQIVCLVPEVAEDSRAKASVQDTLDRFNSTGGNETTGAASLIGVDTWKVIAWVIGLASVFAY